MQNIAKVTKKVGEGSLSNRSIELVNLMVSLINFDIDKLDSARVIYFDKNDCQEEIGWFGVIVDGLGLLKTHPEVKFNVKVITANYSEKLQQYEMNEHNIQNIKGSKIVAHCFNKFRDMDFSDLVRIDATTASRLGKRYNISCVFARNDLES